jgi:hypothetical protein
MIGVQVSTASTPLLDQVSSQHIRTLRDQRIK